MDCLGAGIRTVAQEILPSATSSLWILEQLSFIPICEKKQQLACFCGCCEDETLGVYKDLGFLC